MPSLTLCVLCECTYVYSHTEYVRNTHITYQIHHHTAHAIGIRHTYIHKHTLSGRLKDGKAKIHCVAEFNMNNKSLGLWYPQIPLSLYGGSEG